MRYGYSDYPRDGFNLDQVIDWQGKSEALLGTPLESLDEAGQLELAGHLRSHTLDLFRDDGSRFYIHGTTTISPEYDESDPDRDAKDWQTLKDKFFNSNLQVDTQAGGNSPQKYVYDSISMAASLERLPEVRAAAEAAHNEIAVNFETDKAAYGNKYANLRATTAIAHRLNAMLGQDIYQVPPFVGVPATFYANAKQKDIDPADIKSYLEWTEQNAENGYWVRSSAVHSEDLEGSTAAGIYESVFVPSGQRTSELIVAMKAVYASVDSDEAVRYRNEHSVSSEVMGLVIQANVADKSGRGWGYSNGAVPGVAALHEIYVIGRSRDDEPATMLRMPFWRDKTLLDLAHQPHTYAGQVWWDSQGSYSTAPYFAFDSRRADPSTFMKASYMSRFSELVYGRPVQQEFIDGDYFYALQSRPLPASLIEVPETFNGFPDAPYHYSGRALGIANGIEGEPIEDNRIGAGIPNDGKPYIVVAESNFGLSAIKAWMLKGAKAVVVVDDQIYTVSGGQGAHMETLCAEMGIPCSFATYTDPEGEHEYTETAFRKLLSLGKITLYMDGLQSRVY
ncbi:MAG: hypothetical protein JWM81_355 [Candidatus Saccharibacteria bacterium]|nr:hypothetical protein [Candidatus Saccharibacteria bacterium]